MTTPVHLTSSSGDDAAPPGGEAAEEWSISVDAGLVAAALDLLVVFHDLIDRRHRDGCVDYQLRSVIRADETEPFTSGCISRRDRAVHFRLHQMRATLRTTGRHLAEALQAGGFFAEATHARREWRTPR